MADLNTRQRPAQAPRLPDWAAAAGTLSRLRPGALWRDHRVFTILVLLALVPRILAALAFRPALLTADSFLYMQGAVTGRLGVIRPSGYSFLLYLFKHLPHALLVVTTLQHLMGIAVAVIVYALLRYWGLPGWGASLAAVPTLFDAREIALESYILPDTVFCLVILVTVALMLTRRTPRLWQCAVAGLLMAYASILRGNGIPLVVIVAAFMLIRRVGWRALAAAAAAFVVPVAGYVLAFHAQYGTFNLTTSDGLFLWSRTTSFANCAIIKPPPDLRPLCPNLEKSIYVPAATGWSVSRLLGQPTPADYLWARDAWWRTDAHPGINPANNQLGQRFAIDAITAQPLDYLRVVGRDVLLTFVATDRPQGGAYMTFTRQPRIPVLPWYYRDDIRAYAHTTSNSHAVDPYAFFVLLYQQPVIFPGLLFLLVLLGGFVGVVRAWRRWGGMAALPWALAAVSVVTPALLTQSLYRYVLVAVPLACLAAGLAFADLRPRQARHTRNPAAPAPVPSPSPPSPSSPTTLDATPAPPTSPRKPSPSSPTTLDASPAPPTTPPTPSPSSPTTLDASPAAPTSPRRPSPLPPASLPKRIPRPPASSFKASPRPPITPPSPRSTAPQTPPAT